MAPKPEREPTTHSDWRALFRDRLFGADEAVRRVKDGDLVRLPMGPVPVTLVNALALIDLAHPDFRDHLRSEARRLFWP